jgi:hypothetical protein
MEPDRKRGPDVATRDTPHKDETLKRRSDAVGQSGRWSRDEPGEKRYGNEERWHSSEHPSGMPAEAPQDKPNAEKPNASPYQGRFAPPDEAGEQHGDDQSRYKAGSYAQAGGKIGGDLPTHPGDGRWEAEGGAGHGEQYGSGRDAGGNGTKRPTPGRRPT